MFGVVGRHPPILHVGVGLHGMGDSGRAILVGISGETSSSGDETSTTGDNYGSRSLLINVTRLRTGG